MWNVQEGKVGKETPQCTAFIWTWAYLKASGSTESCSTLQIHDSFKMPKYSFIVFSIHLCILVCLSTAQHHGPWRHKVKWETNGKVYSLLSTGSQYHTPVSGKRNARFFLTRHMPAFSSRIFMGRSANTKIHTVGHVVHSNAVPEYSTDARPYMISGYASHIGNNNQLPLHTKRPGVSSDEVPQSVQYWTAPTGTSTLDASGNSRASRRHDLVTSTPMPQCTSATGNPSTIQSEEILLPQPQLSPLTGSTTANKSKLLTRTDLAAPSVTVNYRDIHPRFQAEERGGDGIIGDEPTNPQANNTETRFTTICSRMEVAIDLLREKRVMLQGFFITVNTTFVPLLSNVQIIQWLSKFHTTFF